MTATLDAPVQEPDRRTGWAGWIHRAIPAAGAWSLLYAALNLLWALGGPGFPFGTGHDETAEVSILAHVERSAAAPVIAALSAVGVAVALAMARQSGNRHPRHRGRGAPLVVFAAAAAVALVLVIPDYRVLATVAYTPIVVLGAPFGWPAEASPLDLLHWPVLNQLLCIVGGVAWAGAAVASRRGVRQACPDCGRAELAAPWTTPAAAARWGRWAVAVAVLTPALYAATRLAWALGIPLGVTDEFLREMQDSGLTTAGAALAGLGLLGAALTLGLVQRWGEVYPRWIPWRAGRPVPPALAIVPASLVSVLVATAGLMFVRLVITGTLGDLFTFADGQWAAVGPELLWPAWGAALAAATLAYHLRRRRPCPRCGRGECRDAKASGAAVQPQRAGRR